MVYKLNDAKVLQAIECIIKDTDRKYDECLVERFLDFLKETPDDGWLKATESILDRIKSYMDHKAFVMLNQARTYKIIHSILETKNFYLDQTEMNMLEPCLNSLWDTLDIVILNRNSGAMTVMLAIFNLLVIPAPGFRWIIDKKIEPPIRLANEVEISDLISLLRYYLENNNNYHTMNQAERLFEALTLSSQLKDLPLSHPLVISTRQLIKDLTLKGSSSMVKILINFMASATDSHIKVDVDFLLERYSIREVAHESFMKLIEQPALNDTLLKNLCKCLALSHSSRNQIHIDKLSSRNKLDSIIIYLSHSFITDTEFDHQLLTYTLYPLLANCDDDEDIQVLIGKLMASRDDRIFIDRNTNSRIVTLCLTELYEILSYKSHILNWNEFDRRDHHVHPKILTLIIDTLINFIRRNYKSTKEHKNIMECCKVLEGLRHVYRRYGEKIVAHTLTSIHSIIEAMEFNQDSKPILLKLINVMSLTQSEHYELPETSRLCCCLAKSVDLALKFDDHDIMDEFVSLFIKSNVVKLYERSLPNLRKYVQLIWKHMSLGARDTEHRELFGNLAPLLVEIDLLVDSSTLEFHGIKRYHDIPMLLGDILTEKATFLPTVEKIVWCLDDYSKELRYNGGVRDCLDHVALGLCATVKGEAEDNTRLVALKILNEYLVEIMTEINNSTHILRRLVSSGIMETLYEVVTGSMYTLWWYEEANSKIPMIKERLIKLDAPDDKIIKFLTRDLDEADIEMYQMRLSKAKLIAKFYLSTTEYTRMPEEEMCEKLELSSLVDMIVDYKESEIPDCY